MRSYSWRSNSNYLNCWCCLLQCFTNLGTFWPQSSLYSRSALQESLDSAFRLSCCILKPSYEGGQSFKPTQSDPLQVLYNRPKHGCVIAKTLLTQPICTILLFLKSSHYLYHLSLFTKTDTRKSRRILRVQVLYFFNPLSRNLPLLLIIAVIRFISKNDDVRSNTVTRFI